MNRTATGVVPRTPVRSVCRGLLRRSIRSLVGAATVLSMLSPVRPADASPGELDVTFGIGGAIRTNIGGTYDWAYAVALQPDGRILAAGVSEAGGTYDFALARYTSTKDLDPTFGDGGIVLTDFGGGYDWAYAIALQDDGKIVAGGVSSATGSKDLALARYNPDGSLDRSFADGGRLVHGLRPLTSDIIHGLAIQPDGKIVVAGVTFEDTMTLRPHGDFVVARFSPDGRPDPTFGLGGVTTTDFDRESYDEAYALALQPNGAIVLGGYTNSGGGPGVLFGADQLALARYTPGGLLDLAFGDRGQVVFDGGTMDEEIRSVVVTPDQTILAGGFVNGEKRGDLLLARLDPRGALVAGFGNTGAGYSVADLGTHSERISSLALQPDGKIVAGGQTAVGHHADLAVFRFDRHGLLDPSFNSDGVAVFDFQGREDRVNGVAIQPDGKLVAVGQSEADFAVARFTAR